MHYESMSTLTGDARDNVRDTFAPAILAEFLEIEYAASFDCKEVEVASCCRASPHLENDFDDAKSLVAVK